MLLTYEELKEKGVLDFEKFEKKRLEGHKKSKKGLFIGLAIEILASLLAVYMFVSSKTILGIIILVIGTIVFLLVWVMFNLSGIEALKKTIYPDVLSSVDGGITYDVSDEEVNQTVRDSLGFKNPSGVLLDDVFRGKMNGNNFVIADLKLKSEDTVTFYGAFAVLDFPVGLPMTLISQITKTGKSFEITGSAYSRIIFEENEDFNDTFIVETSDERTARIILNPFFIQYLIKLSNKYNVSVSWNKNQIIFADNARIDKFELPLNKPITDELVKKFYNEFKDYYDILEEIHSFVTSGVGVHGLEDDVPPPPTEA